MEGHAPCGSRRPRSGSIDDIDAAPPTLRCGGNAGRRGPPWLPMIGQGHWLANGSIIGVAQVRLLVAPVPWAILQGNFVGGLGEP